MFISHYIHHRLSAALWVLYTILLFTLNVNLCWNEQMEYPE